MRLKCQTSGAKCPPYRHEGAFSADNATLRRLQPDLNRCGACMAATPPKLPGIRDDLVQIASLTLVEKGSDFDPHHVSGASFGTFIRPHICFKLMNEKKREVVQLNRFTPASSSRFVLTTVGYEEPAENLIENHPDLEAEAFVDRIVDAALRDDFQAALPQLLRGLTPRERQVFEAVRNDRIPTEIAIDLQLTAGRVSQLVKQVEQKLRTGCHRLGLLPGPL